MSDYLELPDLDGAEVSQGEPIPEGTVRPNRTTQPLDAGTNIPELDPFQRVVEEPNDEVIAAREEKERRQKEKGPAAKRKSVTVQKPEPKKKRKTQVGENVLSLSADKTVDVDPLNVAAPQKEPGIF